MNLDHTSFVFLRFDVRPCRLCTLQARIDTVAKFVALNDNVEDVLLHREGKNKDYAFLKESPREG